MTSLGSGVIWTHANSRCSCMLGYPEWTAPNRRPPGQRALGRVQGTFHLVDGAVDHRRVDRARHADRNASHHAHSWDIARGVMERTVRRGRERKQSIPSRYLGVDEKAFRNGHDYVTPWFAI